MGRWNRDLMMEAIMQGKGRQACLEEIEKKSKQFLAENEIVEWQYKHTPHETWRTMMDMVKQIAEKHFSIPNQRTAEHNDLVLDRKRLYCWQ